MTKTTIALLGLLALASPSLAAESLSFRSWRARAERLEREKDAEGAASAWSNALSTWRESDGKAARAKAWCARAALREKAGQEAGALSDLTECLSIDQKNAKALHRRGVLLLKAGKRGDAINDFYKAVALDIRFGAAYYDRGQAYEAGGDVAFAKEDYKHACELGVKDACARAKGLRPGAKPAPKPAAPEEPGLEPVPQAPSGDAFPPELAPGAPKAKPGKPRRIPYTPRFADCRERLEACLDEGGAFGSCVAERPSCDKQAVKGCCPAPCIKAFNKASASSSEANAYRQHFAPDAACAAGPPSDDDE